MKTNKLWNIVVMSVMVFCAMVSLVSCGSDDNDEGSGELGINGWYVDKTSLASASDFIQINNAIKNKEVLSQYTYGGTTHKYVASRSLFFTDNGMWSDSDASFGRLRFSIKSCITVYKIIDDNTIVRYIGYLYDEKASGAKGQEKLYSFNAGEIFGTLTYYGTPTYYTYVREGNVMVLTSGDIFTITSSGLIKDGSSQLYSKYNPNDYVNDNVSDGGNDVTIGEVRTFTVKGVTFKMMPVKAGTFTMGATSEQTMVYDDEKPAHQVTFTKDYYIGETEVTQALWKAVTGYSPTSDGKQWSSTYGMGDGYPAYYISYEDVQSFISKLNSLTGETFRMPTEAEWEYAARGGNKSKGYMYSGSNTLVNVAWCAENSNDRTHSVKTKSPNELDIYDMSGNVWEWCSDWYGYDYYMYSPSYDPMGPGYGDEYDNMYRAGYSFCEERVFRGGGWSNNEARGRCQVAIRYSEFPSARGSDLGFRLALSSK